MRDQHRSAVEESETLRASVTAALAGMSLVMSQAQKRRPWALASAEAW
jgi:hypothetical protein